MIPSWIPSENKANIVCGFGFTIGFWRTAFFKQLVIDFFNMNSPCPTDPCLCPPYFSAKKKAATGNISIIDNISSHNLLEITYNGFTRSVPDSVFLQKSPSKPPQVWYMENIDAGTKCRLRVVGREYWRLSG